MLNVQSVKYAPGNLPKMQKVAFKGDNESKANNGKFDLSEGAKQFGKGFVSPITSIFSSVQSAATTAAVAAGALFIVNKVKQAGPLLVAAGTAFGLFQIANSAVKLAKAEDGDAKERALFDAGAGFGAVGISVITSKPILTNSTKSLGLADEVANLSTPKSYIRSFKEVPNSFKKTFSSLDKGDGIFVKMRNLIKGSKNTNIAKETTTLAEGAKEAATATATILETSQSEVLKDVNFAEMAN